MKKPNENSLGVIFALGAVLIWSGSFVLARGLSSYLPPMALSFWRWTIALLGIAPFAIKSTWNNRMLIKEKIGYLSLTSFFGIALFNTLVYIAGKTTTSFNLSLIALTTPIFIVVLSVLFLKEKLKAMNLMGISLVIIGVMLLLTKGNPWTLLDFKFSKGDLWMLLAAVVFAIYALLIRIKPKNIDTKTFLFITFFIGDLLLFPAYLWEYNANTNDIAISNKIILALLYLGIFASLVAFYLWNEAIAKIGASKTAIIYYLIPVFSGVLGFIYLGETIALGQLISMVVIIVGLLIYNR